MAVAVKYPHNPVKLLNNRDCYIKDKNYHSDIIVGAISKDPVGINVNNRSPNNTEETLLIEYLLKSNELILT
jgi:hypothetical protein